MTPTVVKSDDEFGVFSVSFKNIDPGIHTLSLPAGTYNRAISFIGPYSSSPDRAWLNLYCKNPNAAAPIEAGLQLLNRFQIGFEGNMWQEHSLDLTVDSEGRSVVLECGVLNGQGCVFLLKLIGSD